MTSDTQKFSLIVDKGNKGAFVHPPTNFHSWIKADGSTEFKPERNRYHLYVS